MISEETLTDIASRGLITKGEKEELIKNQEDAEAHRFWMRADFPRPLTVGMVLKWQNDAEKLETVDSLFAELEIPIPYDLWLAESIQIRDRLKKRIEEVTPNGYIPTRKLVWTDEAFSIVKVELQKILGEEK